MRTPPVRADQLAVITQSQDEAVRGLEKAVRLYSEQMAREIRAQEGTNQLFMILTVLLAATVVAGVFRPMARSIHSETSQLEDRRADAAREQRAPDVPQRAHPGARGDRAEERGARGGGAGPR